MFAVGIALPGQLRLRPGRHAAVRAVDKAWIDVINSRYIVGLDGISLPLLAADLFIVPLVIIYSWNHFPEPHNPKAFLILILILETGMVGTFVAQDLILFFVFFEVVLLPMYFMIGVWGGEQRQYASIKFFLYTLFGSALMIVAFLALYFLAEGPRRRPAPHLRHALLSRLGRCRADPRPPRCWSSAACSWASASRCRCSRSTPGCPTPTPRRRPQGSVILAAVLLKLGTYGFVRIAIPILPEAAQ